MCVNKKFWRCIQMHESFVALLAVRVDLVSEGDELFAIRAKAQGQSGFFFPVSSAYLSPERWQLHKSNCSIISQDDPHCLPHSVLVQRTATKECPNLEYIHLHTPFNQVSAKHAAFSTRIASVQKMNKCFKNLLCFLHCKFSVLSKKMHYHPLGYYTSVGTELLCLTLFIV